MQSEINMTMIVYLSLLKMTSLMCTIQILYAFLKAYNVIELKHWYILIYLILHFLVLSNRHFIKDIIHEKMLNY